MQVSCFLAAIVMSGCDDGGFAHVDLPVMELQIIIEGDGVGKVVAPDLECESTCSEYYVVDTTLVLSAATSNGDESFFESWSGDGCSDSAHECEVVMDRDRTIRATFGYQTFNTVFLSSKRAPGTLGGVDAYDDLCNLLASSAGINNASGDAYSAWVKAEGEAFLSRLGAARGFVRTDGKAVADRLTGPDSLLDSHVLFNPIDIDEKGRRVAGYVWTDCGGWRDPTVIGYWGRSTSGPGSWSIVGNIACGASAHIYCSMTSRRGAQLTPPRTAGRLIFLSREMLQPGASVDVGTADAICQTEAEGAGLRGDFRALLATTEHAASARVDPESTYVRPDGQVVGTGQDWLFTSRFVGGPILESGVWQHADGEYTEDTRVFTGALTPDSIGTVETTCDDWTSSSDQLSPTRGFGSETESNWWDGSGGTCNTSDRIYCIEQ